MLQLLHEANTVPFDTFFQDNYNRTVQYVYNKIGNMQDAEDLAGDVFEYCFKRYDSYDPGKGSLTTWLYLIVNCRIKNHYRDTKSFVDLESLIGVLTDDNAADMDKTIYLEQLQAVLAKALAGLPERQRRIVIMRYFEDRTSADIGKALGLNAGHVRVLLSRALKALESACADFL